MLSLAGLLLRVGRVLGGRLVSGLRFSVPFAKLKHRVILNFLLDSLFQGHQRKLQDFHALDHARREELALLHPHRSLLA